jgi:predicted naringenin-chalcone synthase
MYLHALATAVPPTRLRQDECLKLISSSELFPRLSRRSRLTLQTVLHGDSGVDTRHFAFTPIEDLFRASADTLNACFREEAPRLAASALSDALAQSGLRANQLDALVVCTCTGYLCPGVTSYVAEKTGLRADAYLQDLVGLGCGAAIPALRSVAALLAANPSATVACVAVEICSAAFYLDDDPGVQISAALFGDGAAATIWRGIPPAAPGPLPALRATGFNTVHIPEARDHIRFEQRFGKLRNILTPAVPALAADAVSRLFAAEPADAPRPSRILSHTGGRDVLDALEAALPGNSLDLSRRVLRENGNISSPSVLFVLDLALRECPAPTRDSPWWLVSFGAGFAAHSCRLVGD